MTSERRRTPGRRVTDAITPIDVQDAFVALTDGILITDAGGAIVSANPAAFRILGEDKLLSRAFEELLLVSGAAVVQDNARPTPPRARSPRAAPIAVPAITRTP